MLLRLALFLLSLLLFHFSSWRQIPGPGPRTRQTVERRLIQFNMKKVFNGTNGSGGTCKERKRKKESFTNVPIYFELKISFAYRWGPSPRIISHVVEGVDLNAKRKTFICVTFLVLSQLFSFLFQGQQPLPKDESFLYEH